MRAVSTILYIASCLAAFATCMYPILSLTGAAGQVYPVMSYNELWGRIFLIAALVGLVCAFFGKNGVSFGMGFIALIAVGGEYLFNISPAMATSATDKMLQEGAFNGLKDLGAATNFQVTGVVLGPSWNIMLYSAIALIVFGFLFAINAKPSN